MPLPANFANADAAPRGFFAHRLCWLRYLGQDGIGAAQRGKGGAIGLQHEAPVAWHAASSPVYTYADQVQLPVARQRQASDAEILR
jgi:hypothetical protein